MPHTGDKPAGQMPHGAVKKDINFEIVHFWVYLYSNETLFTPN